MKFSIRELAIGTLKYSVVALLLAAPTISNAAGFSGARQVKIVHIEGNSFAVVVPVTTFDNPDGCGASSSVMIRTSDPWYKDILAASLLSYAVGGTMNFYVSGCAATPWGFTLRIVYSTDVGS